MHYQNHKRQLAIITYSSYALEKGHYYNQPWNSARFIKWNGENHIDKYTTMSVTAFIKELFGWGIVAEQPFLFEINENQQLYFPILDRSFLKEMLQSFRKRKHQKSQRRPPAKCHLIILDDSGSMRSVREEIVSGCNRLLQSIRDAGRHMKEIKQYNRSIIISSTY